MGFSACVLRALTALCACPGWTTALIGPVLMESALNSSMATCVSVNLAGLGNTVSQKKMSVKAVPVRTVGPVWIITTDTAVSAKPATKVQTVKPISTIVPRGHVRTTASASME